MAWTVAFVVVQIVVWSLLGLLAAKRFDTVGVVRATLLFWALAVMLGRSILRDRLPPGVWLPAIAGLLLVALLPRRLWDSASGLVGEGAAFLAVVLVGVTSLLGVVPDGSHPWATEVAFLASSALVALLLLVVASQRPWWLAAGLGLLAIVTFGWERLRPRPAGPSVLFVLLDTTRRDHVKPFGDRVTEGIVAELSSQGVRFDQAVTVVPKTPESVASFWTGRYPHHHGVRGLYDRLSGEATTLAEVFRSAGYTTWGLIDNGWLTGGRGFGQGFRRFRGYYELATPYGPWTHFSWWRFVDQLSLRRAPRFSAQVRASRLTDAAIELLRSDRGRPFFLYAHYFEPHWPYFPPAETARRYGAPADGRTLVNYAHLLGLTRGQLIFQNRLPEAENEKARRLYRAEVDDTLAEVRRLLSEIDRQALGEDTIIVLTADHGHSLGEHDYYFHHGEFLYDDSIRIPLVLRWPGRLPAGRVVTEQVRSIDLAPTLLQLAGLPSPGMDGRALQRFWLESVDTDLPAFLESDVRMFRENLRRDLPGVLGKMRGVRTSRYKLILNPRSDGLHYELIDLTSDPDELRNLADDPAHGETFLDLREQLWTLLPSPEREALLKAGGFETEREEPGDGTRSDEESLRSLGYIN
jgi:arylsulfatase A-like enzyme